MAKKTKSLLEELETLRAKLSENAQERERVEQMPRTFEEAMARVRATFDRAAERAPININACLAPDDGPMRLASLLVTPDHRLRPEEHQRCLFATMHRERLETMIEEGLRERLDGVETIDSEGCKAWLERLEHERYELEVGEEGLVVQLEAEGSDVLRRPDADPAAVLGWTAG